MLRDAMHIDRPYREALRQAGLDRVDAVLAQVGGTVAAWSRTTDTVFIATPGGAGFYLKRYYYPRWRNRLRTMLRGTLFGRHRGAAEARLLLQMRRLGLPSVRPVAWGCRRIGPFVSASFLITEAVPHATNLTTFARAVQDRRRLLPPAQRQAIAAALGREVASLHEADFSHGQLFWRNILLRFGPAGDPEFFFLDARPRRARHTVVSGDGWWMEELGQVLVSALPFTTRADRMRFACAYFGARKLTRQFKEILRETVRHASRWRLHESQRIHMNDLFENWRRQLARERELDRAAAGGEA